MKKTREEEGSVTVYAALTFAVMLSLLLLLIEGARENAVRMKAACAMNLSVTSVFAEYNKELLRQYDLFFIDASYGQKQASVEQVEKHLKSYLDDNFETRDAVGAVKDLLEIDTEEVDITQFSLASDEKGEVLKRQAVGYMKDLYGMSCIKDLQKELETAQEKEIFTRDVTAERMANQSAIDSVEIPPKQVGEDEWEDVELNNPADAVNATRGVLSLVIPKDTELSAAGINSANYISSREVNKGGGLLGREGVGSVDELIFHEYLLEKCGCYRSPKESGALQYQIEYILAGKNSDVENLKSVVENLLLLRESANVIYLFSSESKMAEAEALAVSLAGAVAMPELAPLVKISLIFAWGYAESLYDVRSLLQGGRIALLKSDESWHYSLEGMLSAAADSETMEEGTGLCYEDYLRLFLAIQKKETTSLRAMDVIEMDVRICEGNAYFRLDTCIDYIDVTVYTASRYGSYQEMKRIHYYY